MDLRFSKWEVRIPVKIGLETFSRYIFVSMSADCCGARNIEVLTLSQGGKQGELKHLESANQQAMAENAGGSSSQ